jgi:hypothetical protein
MEEHKSTGGPDFWDNWKIRDKNANITQRIKTSMCWKGQYKYTTHLYGNVRGSTASYGVHEHVIQEMVKTPEEDPVVIFITWFNTEEFLSFTHSVYLYVS